MPAGRGPLEFIIGEPGFKKILIFRYGNGKEQNNLANDLSGGARLINT